jgi:hypothetical protein
MSPLLDRIGAFFLDPPADREPPDAAAPSAPDRDRPLGLTPSADPSSVRGYAPPLPPGHDGSVRVTAPSAEPREAALNPAAAPASAAASGTGAGSAPESPAQLGFAAVLGAPAAAVPVAAACAGELRVQSRAAAAVLCVWRGGELPAGATTPVVRRLAARLAIAGLTATACGRMAWIALDAEPGLAAVQAERCRATAGVPLVLAIAGPRAPDFEPLLADADVAVAVLPPEADDALRALALATLPSRNALVLPPLPPGPPRWAAMAGLARLRALKVARP